MIEIGARTAFGPNCHVHETAVVGPDCRIGTNVVIKGNVRIGARCVIQSGAVLGEDGFGYHRDEEGYWVHHAHMGGVVLAEDVHVGANTCIDQGTIEPTRIGRGTRVDNLVHLAHNVQVGEDCIIVAKAEVSGSVVLGDGVWIGPNACVKEHLIIGAKALIGIGAVVIRDVPEDVTVAGNPARVINPEVGVRAKM